MLASRAIRHQPGDKPFYRGKSFRAAPILAACLFIAGLTPASADAIDGQWCSPAGKNMKIDGPSITTPGGTKMQGDYDRHSFAYVIPPKEPGAGTKVYTKGSRH